MMKLVLTVQQEYLLRGDATNYTHISPQRVKVRFSTFSLELLSSDQVIKKHIYAACSQYTLLSAAVAFNYCDVLEAVCRCKSELKGPLGTKLVMCSQSFQYIEAY